MIKFSYKISYRLKLQLFFSIFLLNMNYPTNKLELTNRKLHFTIIFKGDGKGKGKEKKVKKDVFFFFWYIYTLMVRLDIAYFAEN